MAKKRLEDGAKMKLVRKIVRKTRQTSEVELKSIDGTLSSAEADDLAVDARSFLEEAAKRAGVTIDTKVLYTGARIQEDGTVYSGIKVRSNVPVIVYTDLIERYIGHWNETYEIVPPK